MWSDVALLEARSGDQFRTLLRDANILRDQGHGDVVSYSRKVFIPLTQLCRDVCHYCTFAKTPRQVSKPFLEPDDVLSIARAGERAGCREALLTLGDKPELRYESARRQLEELGYGSTAQYLEAICSLLLEKTSLLPHVNAGILSSDEMQRLRRVSVSQGLMLENASARLTERGNVHFGSPDKHPEVRLAMLAEGGELAIPFTTGILIGIGETHSERLFSLRALHALHREYGHVQEIIIQNFRAKPGTPMASATEPSIDDLKWTVAAARVIFGPGMNIQVPPNLTPADYPDLISAGINDWGGISPVTPDHVNPEAPWPMIAHLGAVTASANKVLVERLAIYPSFVKAGNRWLDKELQGRVLHAVDSSSFARTDEWMPGTAASLPRHGQAGIRGIGSAGIEDALCKARSGALLTVGEVVELFGARDQNFDRVCREADDMRQRLVGDDVTYVVNRNINYTNVCTFHCHFCAFSKSSSQKGFREQAYDLDLAEVARRAKEAWARGATEVCMQGGIHPSYTGLTYLGLVRAVKDAVPDMHVHAFSPLEVFQGAKTIGLSQEEFLVKLKHEGLGSLPGTAAEILDDEVRSLICPDKITTGQWLDLVETAHRVGLTTTATIMYGHLDTPLHWARHLIAIRDLQMRTGGFSEFVPLPFVHMEAPMYLRGKARKGPTFREAVLMHAIARLTFGSLLRNIQTSWVKMGPEGAQYCLKAGANDLGGTLMNESITRAAGTVHGQEMPPEQMDALIERIGRRPLHRTTLYGCPAESTRLRSYDAVALTEPVFSPLKKAARRMPENSEAGRRA